MKFLGNAVGNAVGGFLKTCGEVIDIASKGGGELIDTAVKTAGAATEQVPHMVTTPVTRIAVGLSNPDENLDAATVILREGGNDAIRKLLSQVMQRTQEAVEEGEANTILKAVRRIYCKGAGPVVKELFFEVIRYTLLAIGLTDFANALLIWQGILTNQVNTDTLAFILEHKSDLALFLIDLIEPAKLYVPAFPGNSGRTSQNSHGRDHEYNDLNLNKEMNKHAVICQLQRLAKSLAYILLKSKEGERLEHLRMDTTLRSDFDDSGRVITQQVLTINAQRRRPNHGEQWIFVNGICGEWAWLELYCRKLQGTFNRDIRGVFNRGDGILWDLVECAGERDTGGPQNDLIQRTATSKTAQETLANELSDALRDRNSNGYIVMIAYSQGCLLLRLVLQDFIRDDQYRDAMAKRLRVFTFGNPSIDWMAMSHENKIPICDRVNYTEHFANQKDFVAKLGVLRTGREEDLQSAGYTHEKSSVFVNTSEDWVGHMFGTQYSLRSEEYDNGERSKLLACVGGRPME